MGLDQLAEQLQAGARGLRPDLPRDGHGMSPDRDGGNGNGEDENRADETQEHELGDEFREDIDDEDVEDEDGEELDEEDELDQVVSAETQEWDGLDAAEADADEPTLVAS